VLRVLNYTVYKLFLCNRGENYFFKFSWVRENVAKPMIKHESSVRHFCGTQKSAFNFILAPILDEVRNKKEMNELGLR